MSGEVVRDSYDAMAAKYAELFLGELTNDSAAIAHLARFAEDAKLQNGPVFDLGCGPGHVTNHLAEIGVNTVGHDLSPGQVAEARQAFPKLRFEVGDLTALDVIGSSLGGIVARYSIIHMQPCHLGETFREWFRVLDLGAPLYMSFFGSLTAEAHGAPFDHKVVTAYELWPPKVAEELEGAGFVNVHVDTLPPPEGGRPLSRATITANMPVSRLED